MLKPRKEWRADRGARAIKNMVAIEASISALDDEDLLDLADIFDGAIDTPLGKMAAAEMAKRNIGL